MKKITPLLGAAAVLAGAVILRPGTHAHHLARRGLDRAARKLRDVRGRLTGVRHRLFRRRLSGSVPGGVLADRVRSRLGPVTARLDLPRIHVMVQDHTVLLHGDVATNADADEIERAAATTPGVGGVDSHLHIGLLASDTRPSSGRRPDAHSHTMQELLAAARSGGVAEADADAVVRAVLGELAVLVPSGERDHLATHLPDDVRALLVPPPRRRRRPRTVADLAARIAATSGAHYTEARSATAAVVGRLVELVPEEAYDLAAVLPTGLEDLVRRRPPESA